MSGECHSEWLTRVVAGLRPAMVTSARVRQLCAGLACGCSVAELTEQLRRRGIAVTEAPSLPTYPGNPRYAALLSSLHAAGHEHLLSFLRPALPGEIRMLDCLSVRAAAHWRPVGPAHLGALRRHVHDSYSRAQRAPAESVLSELDDAAAEPTALWRLVLYQVSRFLFARLRTDLRPTDTEQALTALGVADDEVPLLAFAILERFPPRHDEVVLSLAAAVEARALARASRLATRLPRTPPPDAAFAAVLADLRAGQDELARLLAEGARCEATGDVEAAARAYLRATEVCADEDAATDGLRRCPPGAPTQLRAALRTDTVELTWQPPGAAGRITFRVSRSLSRPAGQPAGREILVAETDQCRWADRAPVATEMRYHVRAVRAGLAVSAAAVSGPLVVLPDVLGPTAAIGQDCVELTWRRPSEAADVAVLRAAGNGSPPRRLTPDADGLLRDRDVQPGYRYMYRIVAGYRIGDRRVESGGAELTVHYEELPEAVDGVEVADCGAGVVELSWTEPARSEVQVVRSDRPPADPAGAVLPVGQLSRLGVLVPGPPVGRRGRTRLRAIPPADGTSFFTVVSMLGARLRVGTTRSVQVPTPVGDFAAERFGRQARLRWVWPDGKSTALVQWRPVAAAPGTVSQRWVSQHWVSLADHERGGGVRIPVPAGAVLLSVAWAEPTSADLILDVGRYAVLEPLTAGAIEVSYDILARRLPPSRRTLRLTAPTLTGALPTLRLVARPGTRRPLSVRPGDRTLLELDRLQLRPDQPENHDFDVGGLPRPCYLRAFFDDDSAARLIDPPADHLRLT